MNAQTEQAPTKRDRREQPAYPLAEAARYLKLPVTTLRSWVVGRPYPKAGSVEHFHPLIKAAQAKPLLLSFWNLIEAHVLLSLRTGPCYRDSRSPRRDPLCRARTGA